MGTHYSQLKHPNSLMRDISNSRHGAYQWASQGIAESFLRVRPGKTNPIGLKTMGYHA